MSHGDSAEPAQRVNTSGEPGAVGESTVLDTRGLRCPEPVMLLHKAIKPLQAGDALTVLASDPTTQRDIPQFCRFLGHELRESRQQDDEFIFILIKGA